MSKLIKTIQEELKKNSDEKTLKTGSNFFREEIRLYGVKSATVSSISKIYFKSIQEKSKNEIFDLCTELWQRGYLEDSFVACNWSYALKKRYEEKDIKLFEKWVDSYVSNWASCDSLCNHTIGAFVEMYPQHLSTLKKWAKSKNLWMRRAAAVTLIISARHGLFLKDIFEIADILLMDKEDLVQKGYGWMLKAASESHQKEVFNYVLDKKDVMPRTSLRYAIEKMPEAMKKKAMVRSK